MESENNELETIKEQFQAILQTSYDGIYITDKNGVFLNINDRLIKFTGLKREDLIGTRAQDLVEKGIIDKSVVQIVINTKEPNTIEQTVSGETLKSFMTTAIPLLDDDKKIKYIVANIRDMTNLINLENKFKKAQCLSKQYYSELIKEKGLKEKIVAESEEMKHLIQMSYRVAHVDSSVLLEGESGTGKGVISKFIHDMSPRNKGPFINIDCADIPEMLLESELFGYEEGAFTGARKGGKVGLIELAEGGTLFLDEVNSLPMTLQGKLLRVIETGEITRLGAKKPNKIDFRLISATNKDLKELVDKGLFRKDLFFRLNIVPIRLIPLRERKKDIIPLVTHYLNYFNNKYNFHKELSIDTLKCLENYSWPGNVRELKNVVERLVVMTAEDLITEKELPSELISTPNNNDKFQITLKEVVPLNELIEEAETKLVYLAIKQCSSTRDAAKALHISQTSVVRKFKKLKKKLRL